MCTLKGAKSAFQGAKCDCIKKPLNWDLVLQILAYVAQKEREFIVSRTKEGIAAAKARGVRLGRPEKEVPEGFDWVYDMWKAGYISAREGARKLGINHKTFRKWCDGRELS